MSAKIRLKTWLKDKKKKHYGEKTYIVTAAVFCVHRERTTIYFIRRKSIMAKRRGSHVFFFSFSALPQFIIVFITVRG